MTIETLVNKIQHTATLGILAYSYNFKVPTVDDMTVYLEEVVVSPSAYTISGLGVATGGNVTFDAQPTVDETITIAREVEMTQEVDYQPYDPFPADVHEGALDKLTMVDQQIQEELDRAIRAPITDDGTTDYTLPLYDAGKAIMWDELAKELTNSDDDINGLLTACQAEVVLCEAETAKCVAETAKCVAETAKCEAETVLCEAAKTAAEAAQVAAELAETGAETAETNAETAETGAEAAETGALAAQVAAEAAQAAAEAVTPTISDSAPSGGSDGDIWYEY